MTEYTSVPHPYGAPRDERIEELKKQIEVKVEWEQKFTDVKKLTDPTFFTPDFLEELKQRLGPAPVLIGVGGLKTSGKDAMSDYLVQQAHFIKLGMSDALGDALYTLNPYIKTQDTDTIPFDPEGPYAGQQPSRMPLYTRYQPYVDRYGYTAAKENPEVRRLLQVLGTEVGRDMIDENVWANISEKRIQKYRSEGHPVILTGVRFRNERDMIERNGGTLVWIDRPGLEAADGHASENSLTKEDFQVVIENDGTLQDLYVKAENLLRELTGAHNDD